MSKILTVTATVNGLRHGRQFVLEIDAEESVFINWWLAELTKSAGRPDEGTIEAVVVDGPR